MHAVKKNIPGIILTSGTGLIGILTARLIPGVGAVTLSLLLGILLGNILHNIKEFNTGIIFTEKKILPLSIGLLGVELHARTILALGSSTIILIFVLITVTLASSMMIGRLTGLSGKGSILLGCGNAICGSSAIASVTQVIKGSKDETGLSIAAVNFMGTIGIFLLPFIARAAGFNDLVSADIIGGVLQAVGHVVAAGYSVNNHVGNIAVLIKMSRILMLGPVVFLLSIIYRERNSINRSKMKKLPVPFFIIGFLAMSIISSFSILPRFVLYDIKFIADVLLAVAMAGIGMKIDLRALRFSGPRFLIAETAVMLIQIITAITSALLLNRFL